MKSHTKQLIDCDSKRTNLRGRIARYPRWALCLAGLCFWAPLGLSAESRKPNIVVIIADDLGSADLGFRGSPIATPNLDRMAREGVVLNQHYTYSVCTPTRAAFFTGRYATRFGVDTPFNTQVFPFGTETLASALKSVGYRTGISGKWHLGSKPAWGPIQYGFDHQYGALTGGVGPYCHTYENGKGPFGRTWHRNHEYIEEEGHITDLFTSEGVRFIEENRNRPFLLCMTHAAPHIPLDEPQNWLDSNPRIQDPARKLYAAAVTHLDHGIGKILETLERLDLEDKTLVLFFSDNGAHPPDGNTREYPGVYPNLRIGGSNLPLRGGKSSLHEGGIRMPAITWWPGTLKARQSDALVHVVDWMPTLAGLAGYECSDELKWDGINIWSAVSNGESLESRGLYWRVYHPSTGSVSAVRKGDWKLLVHQGDEPRDPAIGKSNWTRYPKVEPDGVRELFNLAKDPNETNNLAAKRPRKVAELERLLSELRQRDDDALVEQE